MCASTLNKIDINRNVSCSKVVGPKIQFGVSFFHSHTLQGIQRIQYFTDHLTNNYGVEKLMIICIEAAQLELGTFEPFMFIKHNTFRASMLMNIQVSKIMAQSCSQKHGYQNHNDRMMKHS
jgi:hypothetical protein